MNVVPTEEYKVMPYSEELIGTTEYLALWARRRINRCPYKWVRLYFECFAQDSLKHVWSEVVMVVTTDGTGSSETLVTIYQTTRSHIPEHSNCHSTCLLRHGFRTCNFICWLHGEDISQETLSEFPVVKSLSCRAIHIVRYITVNTRCVLIPSDNSCINKRAS
jgi:hypothetical protein